MHQIKEERMEGLFILQIDLNATQKKLWDTSLWNNTSQPQKIFDLPSGCVIYCSLELPPRHLIGKLQTLGFHQGTIGLHEWESLGNENVWMLKSRYTLDHDWLLACSDIFPQTMDFPTQNLLPTWLLSLFDPLMQSNYQGQLERYGVEGVFQLENGSDKPEGFLNPTLISTNIFTKPVLKVSYLHWSDSKNHGIPGTIIWSTGLSLPIHQKK